MMRETVFALALLFALPVGAQQQKPIAESKPLPDEDTFVREVRKRLQTDDERQREYAFIETRRERKLDRNGRIVGETVKIFESYPGLPGEGRWERLVKVDGKPVPAAELEKQDRERQEEVEERLRKQRRQTAADRAELAREREKARREREEMIDDAFRTYEFKMTGRETIDGHETIVFAFRPRPRAVTKTRIGGLLRHFHGRAWISEADYELAKIEVEALDDVSIGWGLLARLHKGSELAFERRKVGGEVWLPFKASYTASARLLLLRRMRVANVSEYSDYRKFAVDTTSSYQTPTAR